MKRKQNFQYYVEGENEKKLINVLKGELRCIQSGKVDKFNVIQNPFTSARIRPLKQNTIVILVYDTDIENLDIFYQNLIFLGKQNAIKDILCVPQVNNLEDELMRSCSLKSIEELTCSSTKKDYKSDLINCRNLDVRLMKCNFDISRFWSCIPKNKFYRWGNDADKIKL